MHRLAILVLVAAVAGIASVDVWSQSSGSSPATLPGAGVGDAQFDAWVGQAHRSFSGRTQEEIDAISMGNRKRERERWRTNYQVTPVPGLGAVFHTGEGENGTDLVTDLYPETGVDGPPTNNVWLIMYDTWWSREWLESANRDDAGGKRTWRHSKNVHLLGLDNDVRKGDGILKQNIRFVRASRRGGDELLREFGETRAAYLGPNTTDHAAIAPSSLGEFTVHVETVTRHFWLIEEGEHQGDLDGWIRSQAGGDDRHTWTSPYGKISSWIADESRDPHLGYFRLDYRVPWNDQANQGIGVFHIFLNPKPARTSGPPTRFAFKNYLVFKNPTAEDMARYVVRPR